ncbi:hypothetical protein JHK82_024461 [Glycine max]|nr:hypothetical protein JHK82_024461 [Glycine max]
MEIFNFMSEDGCFYERAKKVVRWILSKISVLAGGFAKRLLDSLYEDENAGDNSNSKMQGMDIDTVKSASAEISGEGMIETFHNDNEALATVDNRVVVVDLSHFVR